MAQVAIRQLMATATSDDLPTDRAIRSNLTSAVHNALTTRKRIKAVLWYGFGFGGTVGATLVLIVLGFVAPQIGEVAYGPYLAALPIFWSLAGVSVLPTDDRGIARLCIGVLVVTSAIFAYVAVQAALDESIFRIQMCIYTVFFALMTFFQWQTLRVVKGSPAGCCASCCSCCSCCAAKTPKYRMAPRLQLQRCWSVFRYGCFVSHGIPLLVTLLHEPSRQETFNAVDLPFYAYFLHNLTWSLIPLTMTPRVRGLIYRWMMHHGLSEEQSSLMIVAQLVGSDADVNATIEHANSRFRCLPFDELRPRHFERNANDGNELYSLSVSTQIGGHDSGKAKYSALARWAAKFTAENGRQPLIWLDKAGIDQSTLDDADALKQNLACLPVWLAGSHELIMLVGPTYLQRIWCTLEVLVFFRMGKSVDRITLIPLDTRDMMINQGMKQRHSSPDDVMPMPMDVPSAPASPAKATDGHFAALEHKIDILVQEVRELREANDALHKSLQAKDDLLLALNRFRDFDVAHAKCYLEADRQRLLAVVDSAYGSLDQFNTAVRTLFRQENAHRFEWSSKSSLRSLDSTEHLEKERPPALGSEASTKAD